MFADMVDQRCGGGFSITAGDGNDPAVTLVTVSQLNLSDHRNPLLPDLLHPFILFRNARAFQHFIRGKQP
jgi:hypothetical protein